MITKLPRARLISYCLANGLVTGLIANWFYWRLQSPSGGDFGTIGPHALWRYVVVIGVCALNTRIFFEMLSACSRPSLVRGLIYGSIVSVVGSFVCSLAMGAGTPYLEFVVVGTIFLMPVSCVVGGLAGLVLAALSRRHWRLATDDAGAANAQPIGNQHIV